LWPRTKGFVASVKALGKSSSVKAVYDLTIAYAHDGRFFEAPSMTDTLFESNLDNNWRFHVHAQRFEIAEIAGKSDTEIAEWLEQRWIAKSAKLQELQASLEAGKGWEENARPMVSGKKQQ
jgi:hypothetical protein